MSAARTSMPNISVSCWSGKTFGARHIGQEGHREATKSGASRWRVALGIPSSRRRLALHDDAGGEELLDRLVVVPDLAEDLHRMLAQLGGQARGNLVDAL